jgi:hypothetical protein
MSAVVESSPVGSNPTGSIMERIRGSDASYPERYEELKLSADDSEHIDKLIFLLAQDSLVKILESIIEITRLGNIISEIHPIKFVARIISKVEIVENRANVRKILNCSWSKFFIKKSFTSGIKDSLRIAFERGGIKPAYLDGLRAETAEGVRMAEAIEIGMKVGDFSGVIDVLKS